VPLQMLLPKDLDPNRNQKKTNQQVRPHRLSLLTTAPPPKKASPPPKPAPRISAKRQKELDDINRMMEDDDEPQGPQTLTEQKVDHQISRNSQKTPPRHRPQQKKVKTLQPQQKPPNPPPQTPKPKNPSANAGNEGS
jgi:hypothetical protein